MSIQNNSNNKKSNNSAYSGNSNNSIRNFLIKSDKLTINHHIYITIAVFSVLFIAMITYLVVFYCNNKSTFFSNSYNKRESVLYTQNLRGNIYGKDGELLAYSIQNEDGTQTRVYPYGGLFAHSVGFSTHGKTGVEAMQNYYLINTDNSLLQRAENRSQGNLNTCYNVTTTFDVELQQIAYDYLGNYNGAVILTEVQTGRVLVMVSKPDFDPNNIDLLWDQLTENSESSVLLNRVTQGQYPPGSTFKIITALEYFRENNTDYKKYIYNCNGFFTVDNYRINCFHGTRHGDVDFELSFAKSCNASFANIGMSLDRSNFSQTLDSLMFNRELPCPIEYTRSSLYISSDTDDYNMMQTSIGQGKTSISPYHMNLITMAIANDGVLVTPYIIDNVKGTDGAIVKDYASEEAFSLMTADEAEFLQKLMQSVVTEGTAGRLKNDIYTAAGKTGSAEYNDLGDSHAWFTGYAPAENPEVAVTIIIEAGGTGGERAVPLAKLLFDSYFERY